jgi:four helix bundle protein
MVKHNLLNPEKTFIHKMRVGLKELRETFNCLKIIQKKEYAPQTEKLAVALHESNELISIFVTSIGTALKKL